MGMTRRSLAAIVVLVALSPVAGCTSGKKGVAPGAPASSSPVEVPAFAFAVTPAGGAKDVPVSVEIGTEVTGGTVRGVTLREAGGGKAVAGGMRAAGSAW